MTHPSRPWSLRRRLTGRVLILVIGGWLATVAISAAVLDQELKRMFDDELQVLVGTTVLFLDTAQDKGIPRTMGVETNDGERILRIRSPGPDSTPAPWPHLNNDGFHDAPGWRILRRSAENTVIEAAHATDWRRGEMLEAMSAFLVFTLPLIALLLWGLGRTVADATSSAARLATAVRGRSPDDLSPIGQTADLPEELRPLGQALDTYLTRIGALRQAERDFAANAAHELRTPLAALRGQLELSADPDAVAAVATIDGLTRRVERLLQLARLESGVAIGHGPSDVVRILRLLLDELRPSGHAAISFDDSDLDSLIVSADADAMAIMLRNLIENALEHGTGDVRLCLTPAAVLTIENPTDVDSLPENRFQRGEQSSGLGLGLSIVDALAKAMGISLTRQMNRHAMRFELRFPVKGQNPN